jgi:hypothetical protein
VNAFLLKYPNFPMGCCLASGLCAGEQTKLRLVVLYHDTAISCREAYRVVRSEQPCVSHPGLSAGAGTLMQVLPG